MSKPIVKTIFAFGGSLSLLLSGELNIISTYFNSSSLIICLTLIALENVKSYL